MKTNLTLSPNPQMLESGRNYPIPLNLPRNQRTTLTLRLKRVALLSKLNQITVLEANLTAQLLLSKFISAKSPILVKAIIAIVTVGAETALIVHLTVTEIPIILTNQNTGIHVHILLVGQGRGHGLHHTKGIVLAEADGIHIVVTLTKTIDIDVDIPDRDLAVDADPELVPDHTVDLGDIAHTRVSIIGLIQAVVADPEVDLNQEVGLGPIPIRDHTPNRHLIPDPGLGPDHTTNLILAQDHLTNLPSRTTGTRAVLSIGITHQKRIPNTCLGGKVKMKKVGN